MEEIYKQHAKDVYHFLLSLCHNADIAEELTQETFYRALYSIENYDGSCKISVWLCQIAKHIWYQELTKKSKTQTLPLDDNITTSGHTLEETAILRQDKLALYRAISNLEPSVRDVVHLRLTGEFSFAEIGQIINKSENWARVTFYRAKQKIVKGFDEND